MSCGKTCQKLWTSYLNKYGDFRERARAIRDDQECFKRFQLPRLPQRSSTIIHRNKNSSKRYESILPLDRTDREKLEKLIQAQNFPENIFSNDKESSLDNQIEHETTMRSSDRKPSEVETSVSQHPTTNHVFNPYAQWIKRMNQVEKIHQKQSDTDFRRRSSLSTINDSIDQCLEQFLSFLHSLEHSTDQSIDKQTLITLFSLDNHLSSSIDIPIAIEPMKNIPKSLLHQLNNTSISKQIRRKASKNNHRPFPNEIFPRIYDFNQDSDLHSRLSTTYIIKAFKEYLLTHHPSIRLPKLFDDLDRYSHH